MQELLPNIYKVYRDKASGGWGYSYFVKRPAGNLLFARMAKTASIKGEYAAIDAMGGLHGIYITDFHFAGQNVEQVAKKYKVGVHCSLVEVSKIKSRGIDSVKPFSFKTDEIEKGLTVIPTPGHTLGGVCYLLVMDKIRYLFTGDLLYFEADKWVIGSSEYKQVKGSMERLQGFDFDYLIGCGDEGLGCPYIALTPETKKTFFETLANSYA